MTEKEIKKIVKEYLLKKRYRNFKWLDFEKKDEGLYEAIVKDDILISRLVITVTKDKIELCDILLTVNTSKCDTIEL